jgi:hypothetical protein
MNSFFATLLGNLVNVIASLAATKNPSYAPVIAMASSGVSAELAHIAAGNAPTTTQTVEAVAPGALALGAALVAANNPQHIDAIATTLQAVVSSIPTPSEHKDAVSAGLAPTASTSV